MSDSTTSPTLITVGVDGSESSRRALHWAVDLAGRTGADVRAVLCWQDPLTAALTAVMPGFASTLMPAVEMDRAARAGLDAVLDSLPDPTEIDRVVRKGPPAASLVDAGRDSALLVLGRHDGPSGFRLGSTARQVAIHAPCPVAIIDEATPPLPDSFTAVTAIDGSERSQHALAWALTALPAGGRHTAVLCLDDKLAIEMRLESDDVAVDFVAEAGHRLRSSIDGATATADRPADDVENLVLEGDPSDQLVPVAAEADVLVLGDRGRRGLTGLLLGSFATWAVDHVPEGVAVVVVRPTIDDA